MKTLSFVVFAVLIFAPVNVFAQDNVELQRMFDEDQEARRNPDLDWDILDKEDAERREAVLALLAAGDIKTGLDYFNAAVIFQHGEAVEDIRIAHSLATVSATLGYSRANWLKAASWDRLMMYFEQPQWYGTQFSVDDAGNWVLYDVEADIITDEQRAEWSVPSLEEAKARAEARN
ncbi:hypothetical protein CWE09_02200 [Aliidiomarina minuta]|uniref:Uncharacterized protein n=1 Tax=Aliidiomarina minuta TaxID=880057 RepID=A0A432W675_9GAMM|nr:hypothetical protein [Aliidiomarina minuta]RUO25567.1 hypothetical protein CWE09_02200 [Aliidiomarina minuta]